VDSPRVGNCMDGCDMDTLTVGNYGCVIESTGSG
jgi:hypothetical protein